MHCNALRDCTDDGAPAVLPQLRWCCQLIVCAEQLSVATALSFVPCSGKTQTAHAGANCFAMCLSV